MSALRHPAAPRSLRRPAAAAGLALLVVTPAAACPQDAGANEVERFRATLKERAEPLDERAAGVGRLVPDLAFVDFEGRPGRLSDYADRRALVIAVRQIGCPVGERYAPRLARFEREYRERGVAFLFVNMDAFLDPDEVREQELERHGFQGRYVHDPDEVFGRTLGCETTTVCYLLDSARTLRYRGAVDDQHGRGVVGEEARTEYLRDAIEAVLANRPVRVGATSAPGCVLGIEREARERSPESRAPTYHREVSRVLQRNCVECHHADGPGPFALDGYASAFNRRRMIAMVVGERIMPPWFAAEGTGPWKNDRRLSEEERGLILDWVAAGGPAGDPADEPEPLRFEPGWLIGQPDVVFAFPQPYPIPAEGVLEYVYVQASALAPRDLWVSRMQILPSDKRVVHHAAAEVRPRPERERDRAANRAAHSSVPWQYLFGYLPGKDPRSFEEGVSLFIPKGSPIRFGMHYTPVGETTEDLTRLGVVLADGPTPFLAETLYMDTFDLDIPPGAKATFSNEVEVPYDVLLRSITPHMHLRGASFTSEAIYPDGREELLIDIPVWDQDWQNSYEFAEPRALPRGTRLRITGHYDNSAANPSNPDPTQHVRYGQQIDDEMLTMAVEWIRPRAETQEPATPSPPRATD